MSTKTKSSGRAKAAQKEKAAASRRSRSSAPARQAGGSDPVDIFERLRSAVLDQRLLPRMQLKEQALADAFKVNRTVIRTVLTRLQACKLVEHHPNRGMFVSTPTLADKRQIFGARRLIEPAIVEELIDNITSKGVAELDGLVQDEKRAYKTGNLRTGLRLSVEFHRLLARLSKNTVLHGFLDELTARTPLVILAYQRAHSPSCAHDDHQDIVAAIKAGDKRRAASLMRAHLRHLESRIDMEDEAHQDDSDIASLFGYDSFS